MSDPSHVLTAQMEGLELESKPTPGADLNDYSDAHIANLASQVSSPDSNVAVAAVTQLRKVLSREKNPPIQAVIHTGVVPHLIRLLRDSPVAMLQFECAWALTNIMSGSSEETQYVIREGVVPVLLDKVTSREPDVAEQCIWAIGNIAGDGAAPRNVLLEHGVVLKLLEVAAAEQRLTTLRNLAWTVSNVCRGKPKPPFDAVQPFIPLLGYMINSADAEVKTDALWALSYLTDGENFRIQAVIDANILPRVVEVLKNEAAVPSVVTPALRTVGNVVSGNDAQTEYVLGLGVLPALLRMLDVGGKRKAVVKEIYWTISNITAGNSHQIQAVIDSGLAARIMHELGNRGLADDVRKEAIWTVSNMTSGASRDQIAWMVNNNCVKLFSQLLDEFKGPGAAMKELLLVIGGFENILNYDAARVIPLLDETGALDVLEGLQRHPNRQVYDEVAKVMELVAAADDKNEFVMEEAV